ncbi:hypothetical protein EIP86_006127 [Pleurotus ostreatoroseus]|nr:hypothetical protein EIP86_006127 [Pleurotus ostreatoroseus]
MMKPLMKENKVDVLVIGAGPAGLFCANALAKAGVNVRIVDNRPEKVVAGQADGIQPRTLEVLQSYGLAERLLQEGAQLHTVALWGIGPGGGIVRKERAVNITTASTRARYPFETTMHQGHIESIFIDSMTSIGFKVDRPVAPSSMEVSTDEADLADPTSYPVKVVLQHLTGDNQREVVHAKFVVGTDGAHSWVRKASGIAMEGEHTDSLWGVLDIRPETDWPDIRNKGIIHSATGACGVIPREHDMVRLYIQLTEEDVSMDAQGRLLKTETTPAKLLEVAQDIFKPYTLNAAETLWSTIYKTTIILKVNSHLD